MLHGCNIFRLRAKWQRKQRKFVPPSVKTPLTAREGDTTVKVNQYLIAHLHLARVWGKSLVEEYEWFIQSMRGELPAHKKPVRIPVTYIYLPREKYFQALSALTTRLGVKI